MSWTTPTVTLDVYSAIETNISLTETTTATATVTEGHVTTITDSATLDITAWATTVATWMAQRVRP
jgi:hypothetical protein